jgi:hypothetical protein
LVSTVSNIADLTEQNTRSILQLDNNVDRLVTVSNSVITGLQRQGGRNPRDAGRGEGPSDPITLLNHSEPGPDVAIARGKDEDHLPIILTPKTFFSWRKFQFTLTYDQTIKLGLYAEAGITHY